MEHWLTPSRGAERELPPDTVAALRTVADAAAPEALRAALDLGRRLWQMLAERYDQSVLAELFAELDAALGADGGQP